MAIEPSGSGTRVLIRALIDPPGLALAVEEHALADVCQLQAQIQDNNQQKPGEK